MRQVIRYLAFVPVLASLTFVAVVEAQTGPNPPKVSDAHALAFDHSGLNIAGDATTLTTAQVDLLDGSGAVVSSFTQPAAAGEIKVPFKPLLVGQGNGLFTARARVQAENGLWGEWSDPFPVDVDNIPPEKPTNLRRALAD